MCVCKYTKITIHVYFYIMVFYVLHAFLCTGNTHKLENVKFLSVYFN